LKILVVGDIHGCFDELLDLVSKSGIGEEDRIIALGDIVDRGPKIWETFEYFRATPNTQCLMGNHERKNIGIFEGTHIPTKAQNITREQLGKEKYSIMCEWFKSLKYFEVLAEAICIHGFWEHGIPLHEQKETVLAGTYYGEKFIRDNYERVLKKKWFELYDGDLPLIVGHRDYKRDGSPLIWNDKVYCIDTGCVVGGMLTGIVLPEFKIIQVSAKSHYWVVG